MQIEVVTKEDLQLFRVALLNDIKELLGPREHKEQAREWLRSSDVRKMLGVSSGTLQNMRINGTLNPAKINGSYFYRRDELEKLLADSKRKGAHL